MVTQVPFSSRTVSHTPVDGDVCRKDMPKELAEDQLQNEVLVETVLRVKNHSFCRQIHYIQSLSLWGIAISINDYRTLYCRKCLQE